MPPPSPSADDPGQPAGADQPSVGYPPAPPAPLPVRGPRPRRWGLWLGLASAALIVVVAMLCMVGLLLGWLGEPGRYEATAGDLCALPEVAALGPVLGQPTVTRGDDGGAPSVGCIVMVKLSGMSVTSVRFSAVIERSAHAARRRYENEIASLGTGTPSGELPGLGTAAVLYRGAMVTELLAYDGNLVFRLILSPDSPPADPPDLVSKLADIGVAVFNACRGPHAGPPLPSVSVPAAAQSGAGVGPSGRASPGTFHAVDDLCAAAPLRAVGTVLPNTTQHTNRDMPTENDMTCLGYLQTKSPQVTHVQVLALVGKAGRDMNDLYTIERGHSTGATEVSGVGTAAFYQPQYIGGPRFVVYQANLEFSINFFTTDRAGPPPDIADRLKTVALALLDALRS